MKLFLEFFKLVIFNCDFFVFVACKKLNPSLIFFSFYKLECMVLSFHYMQIVLENIINFDIIIETAPNLNKTKSLFFCFFAKLILQTFWISNQPDSRYIPYIFLKRFVHWNHFETKFFKWMGVRALSGPRKRGRACPPFYRKKIFETSFNKKSFCKKWRSFI